MKQLVLPNKVTEFLKTFKQHGFECFVVGGFIRDQLLGRQVQAYGIDFTTNATPQKILQLFPKAKYENRFGTVIVPRANHDFFEVTTYRSEQSYSDSRHPDKIKWGKTLAEDLQRRDFTINALCFDGKALVDLFNGQQDLRSKIIRTINDPNQRFSEDALRLMRAVRFSCQLGFGIEPETLKAISQKAPLLEKISMERIRDEFLKIISSDNPVQGITLLKNSGLLSIFLPEFIETFKIGQVSPQRHHIYDLGTHLLKTLENCPNPNPIVRLACLLHDIGKIKTRAVDKQGIVTFYNHEIIGTEMAYAIGQRLHLSKKDLTKLTKLVRYHQFTVTEEQTDKAVIRFIRMVGKENLQDIIDLRMADRIGSGAKPSSWRTELFLKRIKDVQNKPFTISDLKINGYAVMKTLKLKPGPKVGKILEQVFDKVVRNELQNDKKTLISYLKKLL